MDIVLDWPIPPWTPPLNTYHGVNSHTSHPFIQTKQSSKIHPIKHKVALGWTSDLMQLDFPKPPPKLTNDSKSGITD